MMETDYKCKNCHYCHSLDIQEKTFESDMEKLIFSARFIVCEDCGNKRCPKASHHIHECTNSNKPGQIGSVYP